KFGSGVWLINVNPVKMLIGLAALVSRTRSALQLAYLTHGLRGNQSIMEIHLLDLDHRLTLRLVRLQNEFMVPYGANSVLWWSPDGNSLAFLTDNRDQSGRKLHVLNLTDRGEPSASIGTDGVVTGTTNHIYWVTLDWSPDSRSIAYTTWQQKTGRYNLSLTLDSKLDADITAGITTLVHSEEEEYSGMWSPDGTHFAFLGGSPTSSAVSLYAQSILAPDAHPVRLTQPPVVVSQPRWSPDSTWLVFTGQVTSELHPRSDLYRVNVHQPNAMPERLTEGEGASYAPIWSPDSDKVAYLTNDPGYISLSLLTMPTMETHPLTDRQFRSVTAPSWSPEGSLIAFSATERGSGASLYLINADGTNLTQLTDTTFDEVSPAWRPRK
ncbi:MAG TPA: DPP IV N-terminal domain-containing protein, partial [Phototrophicaceae bacterium]|nr:DPP IV N-terminal domain-containing protein [Phototrophicaceae bacterium]